MRAPWWLRPYREVRDLRGSVRAAHTIIDEQQGRIRLGTAENHRLAGVVTGLRRQLADLMGAGNPEGSFTRSGASTPEFVLAGLDRNGNGKRLMASRHLTGTTMTMTDMADPPPRWKLAAALGQMLVIDKPSYAEALDRMAEIWRNWDAEDRRGQKALAADWQDAGPAEGGVTLSPAIPLMLPPAGAVPAGRICTICGEEAHADMADCPGPRQLMRGGIEE